MFFWRVFWCLDSPILKLMSSSFVTLYSPGHSNWLYSVWTGLCIFSSHMMPCCAEGLYLYLYLQSCMDRARRESNHSEWYINPLVPNDHYRGRAAPLTSKRCILYIYSTNIGTKCFKHGIYFPFFFSLQNAVCFIILTYLVPVLFTFYIQYVLKLRK